MSKTTKRRGHPVRRSWASHPMMSVTGCIDSHGAIHARPSAEISTHTKEEMRGKRWRWLIFTQEFHRLAPRTVEESNYRGSLVLTEDEHFSVCDWLIRHGYADDRILPTPKAGK